MKVGNQFPTQSVILPYSSTKGPIAVRLYNLTGNTLLEWQGLLLEEIMATNEDGLWTHTKFGYSVPRRNGKTEVVSARELEGLFEGEHILHTAHLTDTAHIGWERLMSRLSELGIKPKSSYKAYGKERIELSEEDGGGVIDFRTRTNSGSLGSGYDLLVIDEAQEYTKAQQTALNYVVSSSKNPQTIMTGTPPTAVSAGGVFRDYREATLSGETVNGGWAEWSVDHMTDVRDKEAWYLTNPSLGTILTERIIQDEINGDNIDFNIQRLGLWIKYNQQSAISEPEWDALKVEVMPKLQGRLFAGIKFGKNGENASLSLAVKTADGKVFVEAIDCRSQRDGNGWMINFLKKCDVKTIFIDGASGVESFKKEAKDQKLKVTEAATKEVIEASSDFEKAISAGTICHKGQPSLRQSVCNSQHRAIGSGGGYGYRTLDDDIDVSLMESVILAMYACAQAKEAKAQRVFY